MMQTNGALTDVGVPRRLSIGWNGAFGGTLLALAFNAQPGCGSTADRAG